ncbi:MAG TPA: galactosyltransferase-related protein [Longimicrobiaceae bacterium]|nr:galactosyltransferase-related protein [Longimicrobiaceae bacterium]
MRAPQPVSVVIPCMDKPMAHVVARYFASLPRSVVREVVWVRFLSTSAPPHPAGPGAAPARLREVLVEDQPRFNKPVAANIGAFHARPGPLLFCDADTFVLPRYLRRWSLLLRRDEGTFIHPRRLIESATGAIRAAPGILAVMRHRFAAVEGYSSEFRGWGLEDRDILARLALGGGRGLASGWALHLSHGEAERVRHYGGRPREETRAENRRLFERRMERAERFGTYTRDVGRFSFRTGPGGVVVASARRSDAAAPSPHTPPGDS